MIRDARLRCLQFAHQLAHLRLALPCEEQQDREPRRISEPVEEPGEKTHVLALSADLYFGERFHSYYTFLHRVLLSRLLHYNSHALWRTLVGCTRSRPRELPHAGHLYIKDSEIQENDTPSTRSNTGIQQFIPYDVGVF